MTREDASEILSDEEISCLIGKFHGAKEALDLALSTLQAENEKLRAELDDLRIQWDMYGGDVGITAVYKELEQAKRCIEIVEKQRDAAIKELENYMVQDVLDGNEPCKICAKASDIPCEYCNPKWRGPQKED